MNMTKKTWIASAGLLAIQLAFAGSVWAQKAETKDAAIPPVQCRRH